MPSNSDLETQVLEYILQQGREERRGRRLTCDEIAFALREDEATVQATLRNLFSERYVTGIATGEHGSVVAVFGLTERGRRRLHDAGGNG